MSPEELRRAAEAAAAMGDAEAVAARFAEAAGSLRADEEAYRWALLLLEVGHQESVESLRQQFAGTEVAGRIGNLLEQDETAEVDEKGDDLLDPELAPPEQRSRDEGTIDLFLRWFGGRRDIYARQWFDERRKRSGYRPVEEPLTPEVARAHLDGRITLGQYLLFPDGTVAVGVLDLDLEANALGEWQAADGSASPAWHPALRSFALRLLEVARRMGLVLWPEDSGARGLHLWLLVEPRRPASAVRSLLAQILLAAGPQPPEVRVEIFPKQDRPGLKGLSSLVKLPLGIHQKTLRWCPLLDEQLCPIQDVRVALSRLCPADPEAIAGVLGRRVVPLPAPELEPREGPVPLPSKPTARSLAELLRSIEPGPSEKEACERILAGCAVLRNLVRRAFERRRLEPAEARALLYTIGLVGPACRLIEEVFAAAQISGKEIERVRRGLPSPTGCKRLREIDPTGARECRCPAGREAQPYATPALFAVGATAPAPPTWTPFAPWIEEAPLETADPLQTIAEWLRRIEARLDHLEKKRE
jgi:hypothetical protein